MLKAPALAVPEVGSRASSGRACQLWLARVLEPALELGALEAADASAFGQATLTYPTPNPNPNPKQATWRT